MGQTRSLMHRLQGAQGALSTRIAQIARWWACSGDLEVGMLYMLRGEARSCRYACTGVTER